MCRHILNAQVSVRAPCCQKWFDCPQCHAEASPDHELLRQHEIIMACKKCKKVFKKDSRNEMDESDEYCPHCDNHYVIEAIEPTPILQFESDDPRFFKDPRMKTSNLPDDLLI